MQNEIEAFLRRVAQVREAAEASKKPRRPAPQVESQPAQVPTLARTDEPVKLAPEVVEAELAESAGDIEREVVQHMRGTAEIAEHVRHLGEVTALADDKLEARLHQTFDHQLGHLKKTASDSAAKSPGAPPAELNAAELALRFRTPQGLREAIIMAEVLRRPEERW